MSNDVEPYRIIAQEAVEFVFRSEYHNSLGIPLPKIEMLLADDENYNTGQYYITINQTWQIHLNFGMLPKSYKLFRDEVIVLTRHEIEHYMCCPFDVITQLRMLKKIRDTYNSGFSHLNININKACGSIANQAADIIVDSKNYFRHPKETLRSEIDWIKKGADFKKCPRHSKIMFLTKEFIWGESLEINEDDEELLMSAKILSEVFLKNGIEDKESFLEKTVEYAKVFFRLYQQDASDFANQKGNDESGSSKNQSSSENSGTSTGSGNQSSNQNSEQSANGNKGYQSSSDSPSNGNNTARPKDGDRNGNSIVFADPDKIKEALEILAQETKVEEFIELLEIAGVGDLSKKEIEKIWFAARSANMIPIEEYSNKGAKDVYSYPTPWRVGDPTEDLDMMLSLMTSPLIIPGVTTKKWEMTTNDTLGVEKKLRDLFLIIDTSGSMGKSVDERSNMHQAIMAAYGIISFFEQTEGRIALLGFSDRISIECPWTKDYDDIREKILLNGSGGTRFPINRIENIIDINKTDIVTVLITDGELGNLTESVAYFKNYILENNLLYIFLLGNKRRELNFAPLKDIGANVFQAETASQFSNLVISELQA